MIQRILLPALLVLAAGCGGGEKKTDGDPALDKAPGTYTQEQVLNEADALLTKLKQDDEIRGAIKKRIKNMFNDPAFKKVIAKDPVNAVLVLRGGGGGFVVRTGHSKGLISFAKGQAGVPMECDTVVFGAVIGGSTSVGVVLVTGLQKLKHVAGKYKLMSSGGTAGAGGSGTAKGTSETHNQTLWASAVGTSGWGAQAGKGSATLKFVKPEKKTEKKTAKKTEPAKKTG